MADAQRTTGEASEYWYGRPVDAMSRAELLEAWRALSRLYLRAQAEHARELAMLGRAMQAGR